MFFYNVFFQLPRHAPSSVPSSVTKRATKCLNLATSCPVLCGKCRKWPEELPKLFKNVNWRLVSNFKVMGTFKKLFSVLKFFVCRHVSMWGFRNRVCPYLEKRNHPIFVNISLILMIDTWIEKYSDSSRVLQHENPKIFIWKMVEIEFLNCAEVLPRKEIILSLSILVLR